MALPALLGAGARAVGGSMVKTGGRAVAAKVLGRGRKKQVQPGRIVPGREGMDGGKGGAIIKPKVKMVSAKEIKSLQTGDTVSPGKDPLKSIYSNVILIEKILKGTNIADRDALKEQKKNDKKADKSDQEKKLETKPPKIDKKKGEVMKLPQTGVFGWIKNFIGNILMGYFAVRLIKYLPQMMGLLKGLGRVVDFVTDVGMFLVDGIATFIDFAYNVYDGTRNIMKGIGLEGAFDSIMKAMEVAITVLTFALGAKSLDGFGDSRRGGKPGRSKPQTRIAGPKGNLLGSRDRVTSSAAARRYANRFGRDAAEKRFGKDAVSGLGGKFGRSRVTNFARGAATGVAKKLGGRQGVKMLASLGKIGKFLKVPVIGSIISVVISLMNGDPIQKALFKGVGTAVGGALGGFLSTFIGIPPLGLFLGGIIGDYVGDLLYTLFFGGGLKAAGAKLGNDLKGLFMGIGDGIKAIFSWVFGGGLLDLLKNVGGGLLKFAGYILNPGGLLWDMLKAGGAVVGAITNFIFGGGLLDLIKNVGGGVLKFIGYILMPNGLLFDALKAGGAAAKMIFDFAKSIVGNLVGGAVEGTKRVAGGFFDALTFNLFDFDKQNKVETKKAGGEVGRGLQEDTLKQQKKALRKKPSFQKIKAPEGGQIKTGKKTERAYWDFLGWAGTGGQEETMQLGAGGMMLANRVVNLGNSFGEHPYFGPILSLAAKIILGETPNEEEYKNVGYGLNMLIGDGVQKGKIGEGIKGYEDGGMIDDYYAIAGIDIGRWATDTFKKELSTTLNKTFDTMKSDDKGGNRESSVPSSGTSDTSSGTSDTPPVAVSSLGSGGGSLKDMSEQQFSDLAFVVSHEALRGTDDEYAVAAAVLNRVADPRYPNTIMGVGTAPGQFEAVFSGKAYRDEALAKQLMDNQGMIIDALKKLNGRTDFKAFSSMGQFMGDTDIMFADNGNFYHYAEQKSKSDPIPNNVPQDWKKLLGENSSEEVMIASGEAHPEPKRSHAGTKLSSREQMLKILPGQSLLDENTSKALGATNLARFNAASTPQAIQNIAGQIAGVSDYAPYEQGAQQTVVVQDPPQQMPEESPQSSGGGMIAMSGGSSHDPFEFLDFQG